VWNRRDESVPWVARFGRILNDSRPPGTPDSKDVSWLAAFDGTGGFAPLESALFTFEHEETVDQVIDRAVSVSFIALQPVEVRARVAARIRSFLAEDPQTANCPKVPFPYRTEVYLTQRAD
jgi:hypothetical protein